MKNLTSSYKSILLALSILLLITSGDLFAQGQGNGNSNASWNTIINQAPWAARAGLQVVELNNEFILMGGRTPLNPAVAGFPGASIIWNDVWKSSDYGQTWLPIVAPNTPGHWPERAYFQAVKKGNKVFVMGGQNFQLIPNPDPFGPPFISQSVFYNDVWSSTDGISWVEETDSAKWQGRAGLSAIKFKGKLFVMGGSFNDDPAVIGGPPTRVYFNDVYSSKDGSNWTCETDSAPWAPREGAALAVKNGKLYLFGGEDGFTCIPGLRCPPYYNDVWSTKDGKNWKLVKDEAEWPSRPGHRVEKMRNQFVLFGGFGLSTDPTDPFAPSNPVDMWRSKNGKKWKEINNAPWNAAGPEDVKYDFASLVARGGPNTSGPTIYTFGGDRETFDFADSLNYLNIDNDVWSYSATNSHRLMENNNEDQNKLLSATKIAPNPLYHSSTLSFHLKQGEHVTITIYNMLGMEVKTLANTYFPAGHHSLTWQGDNNNGVKLPSGFYVIRLTAGDIEETQKILISR
ncbi:MAG: T9SS type A sorting domain-containing protein [Bacteroidia bacterium]|nr:T9SS type A sorting domain-containing protein [Bacteroidia bacterium]